MSYYKTLGVPDDASGSAIRTAYRRLARRHHPDVAGSGSADKFREVQQAYETLGERSRRQAYDLSLREPHPIHVTVIQRRPAGVRYAEPLAGRRIDFAGDPFSDLDRIFNEFVRLFGAEWF
jgi:DnaJ-class molecular chaperone